MGAGRDATRRKGPAYAKKLKARKTKKRKPVREIKYNVHDH